MGHREILIVPTGTANIASIIAGFSRAGGTARVSEDSKEIETASHVVLPGVGAFGAAMRRLDSNGVGAAVASRIRAGAPTLCVCLGLQLLFEASGESPGVRGLAVIPGVVGRFSGNVRVPQFGWNMVEPETSCRLIGRGHAYFANSFRVTTVPEGFAAAFADYDGRFVAAFERGGLLACQFHPELSGAWGISLIRRWLDARG